MHLHISISHWIFEIERMEILESSSIIVGSFIKLYIAYTKLGELEVSFFN
jgi:hypothetical protein